MVARAAIAELVAPLVGMPAADIARLLVRPRFPAHGDWALTVPKLFAATATASTPADATTDADAAGSAADPETAAQLARQAQAILAAATVPAPATAVAADRPRVERAEALAVYVNFRLQRSSFLRAVLADVERYGDRYGHQLPLAAPDSPRPGVAVVVRSPSLGKPVGLAALRCILQAQVLANLSETQGYRAIRLSHLADWDLAYGAVARVTRGCDGFMRLTHHAASLRPSRVAAGYLATGFARFGSEERLRALGARHLTEVANQVRRDNQRSIFTATAARQQLRLLRHGDPAARSVWERIRAMARTEHDSVARSYGWLADAWTTAAEAAAEQSRLIGTLRYFSNLLSTAANIALACPVRVMPAEHLRAHGRIQANFTGVAFDTGGPAGVVQLQSEDGEAEPVLDMAGARLPPYDVLRERRRVKTCEEHA